jgi:2-polyprenyl-3-methyl-5-hydroxy-6-metoxy-1,4-benzoquinol methylase
MNEIVSSCPLCKRADYKLFDRRKFRGIDISNQLCNHCGLVFQSPRMTEAQQARFYEEEYRQLYQGGEGPARRDLIVQHGRADWLLHFAKDKITSPERHLDIGCSAGILLTRFQNHFGCQAIGIEPGTAYREYATSQGLTVYPSLEEMGQGKGEQFDLISMAHVLEHLQDPAAQLSQIREKYLKPTGWLMLEVPNLYAHDCFEVAHLVSFSPHTFTQTVRQAGFEVLALKRHGQPRSVVLPLYLTLLARPGKQSLENGKGPLQVENGIPLKRKLGMFRRRMLQRLFPSLAWLPMP